LDGLDGDFIKIETLESYIEGKKTVIILRNEMNLSSDQEIF